MRPFPEEIIRFIEGNIDSVDQLEILRILAADREKKWNSATLAREVQALPQAIAAHLDTLERRGLVMVAREGPNLSGQYGPRTPELEAAMRRLLQLYNERPVTMIRILYARSTNALQSFADAFRIRREE